MAFIIENFTYGRGTVNNYARTTSPAIHSYNTTDDDIAVVEASGYFDGVGPNVLVRDFIMTNSANEPAVLVVVTVDPITTTNILGVLPPESVGTNEIEDLAVTNPKIGLLAVESANIANEAVGTLQLAAEAVDNGNIANGVIEEVKLVTAVQDKLNRIKASAIVTLTSGGVPPDTDTIAIPGKGIVATDVVHVTVRFAGATPLGVVQAEAGVDSIIVQMDGNIVGDEIIQYTVYSPIA